MKIRHLLVIFFIAILIFTIAGCGVTYPKGKFKESVIKVCKKEYNLDVKVDTTGKTIAIYLPLENLIDFTFSITKSASEKINNVILSVSRVALSTDADYDFYCVIAHDVRIPEIQIVIVKSVDDVKRFLLNDISRGEYSKRMIVDIRLSPQAQKERAVKEIFDKMKLDKKWQDDVMNDFFRSEPTALTDIGYWNGRFYIKDITHAEFLSEEIANRVKIEFREDKTLSDIFVLKASKCAYSAKASKCTFRLEISVENKSFDVAEDQSYSNKILGAGLGIMAHVLHSYKFDDFDYVEVLDQKHKTYLKAPKDKLEGFRLKKISLESLLDESK